ncbi:MAG: nucleotidyl transferase AbiEii/AbiGii toxin family protein [Cyanobium sp.]
MFRLEHHRRIASLLEQLDAELLLRHRCLFGGGTAIALRYGEFRQSVDVDLLVSERQGYRELRQRIRRQNSLCPLWKRSPPPFAESREPLTDQYGIRSGVIVEGVAIKLEIVLEGRITLDALAAEDAVCGIASLTVNDLTSSKLLANSDRWNDDGVFNRDLIDLAHLPLTRSGWERAMAKAEEVYGDAVRSDLNKALERLLQREGWLERCREALAIEAPRAELWQRLLRLQKLAGGR